MPTSWEQKRAAIAAALAGGNPQSVGASPMVNPMISAMSPQAPGAGGQGQGQAVAYTGGGQNMARPAMVGGPSVIGNTPPSQLSRVAPRMSFVGGQGQAAQGQPGLMGATPTQGQMMAQANASLAGAPGFDYVPPPAGPAPAPAAAAGQGGAASLDDIRSLLFFGQAPQSIAGNANFWSQNRR